MPTGPSTPRPLLGAFDTETLLGDISVGALEQASGSELDALASMYGVERRAPMLPTWVGELNATIRGLDVPGVTWVETTEADATYAIDEDGLSWWRHADGQWRDYPPGRGPTAWEHLLAEDGL